MKIALPLKITSCFLFVVLCSSVFAFSAKADSQPLITVTPSLIDVSSCEKGMICLEKPITIKNNSSNRVDVYAQVSDISPDSGLVRYKDPSELPADASLTKWINFYRAVITIPPGETATKTLRIDASPNAVPGKYFAEITFPPGGNLPEAQQADAEKNQAKIRVNLAIKSHTVELAEVNLFKPAKIIFGGNPIGFSLKIKNPGNVSVAPAGEIIIYNKGGKEVGLIAVKEQEVLPGEIIDFSSAGNLKIGPGKYKAKLALTYGQDNKDLPDITYFSYLPPFFFLGLVVVLLGLVLAGAFWVVRRRRERLAAVGDQSESFGEEYLEAEDYEEEKTDDALLAKKLKSAKYVINLKK